MSLIPCDDDCVYQVDGYCKLETPTAVTNHLGGCMHYVKAVTCVGCVSLENEGKNITVQALQKPL